MKNYLNRALLFKDLKYAKWLGLLFFGELLFFKTFVFISELRLAKQLSLKNIPYTDMFQSFKWSLAMSHDSKSSYLLITVAIIAAALMWHERSSSSYALTASMPFGRLEIMTGKLLLGNAIIFLTFFSNLIIMSIIFAANKETMTNNMIYMDLPKWFLINSTAYMAVFTFLMFVQSVMGNSLIAGIAGIILVAIPKTLFDAIASILSTHGLSSIPQYLRQIGKKLYLFSYNDGSLAKIGDSPYNLYYMNYCWKIVILATVIITFSILSIYLYRKNRLELSGSLVMFKPLETLFRIGFAICFGIPFAYIFNSGVPYISNLKHLPFDLLIVLGTGIGYFIASKIVKTTSKSVAR